MWPCATPRPPRPPRPDIAIVAPRLCYPCRSSKSDEVRRLSFQDLLPGPQPDDFLWASGIEDTFVPQVRPGHRALDEYRLMGHYEHWREDLALARELGLKAL